MTQINRKPPTNWERIQSMAGILISSIFSIIFVLFGIGVYGLTRAFQNRDEKDCNFYTVVTILNMILFCGLIYLIIKLFWN